MGRAKDIILRPITSKTANAFVKKYHYSGKVVQNSQLHFGVFLNERLGGVMSYGPSINKKGTINIVRDTSWYGFIEWVVSFSDGTQCGDGAIYRASGFVLTDMRVNTDLRKNPATGEVLHSIAGRHHKMIRGFNTWETLEGYQLRYIYFLNPKAKERLTVPIIPFSKIDEMGASMYKGERITRCKQAISDDQSESGGASPTAPLQTKGENHVKK